MAPAVRDEHKPLGVAETERLVKKIVNDDKELRFIFHAMDKLGCPVPQGKFFQVRECSQSVSGGYYPPEGVSLEWESRVEARTEYDGE